MPGKIFRFGPTPEHRAQHLFVFLHGSGATSQSMIPIAFRFQARFPSAALVVPSGFASSDVDRDAQQWYSSRGLTDENRIERVVLISPPSDLVDYSRRFARWFAIPERVRRAMQAAIEERFGVRWAELELARVAPRLRAEALVIHDRGDARVPWRHGAAVAQRWPGARLLSTSGLGHRRILEDDAVARAAADFIAGRTAVAPLAHPALPDPAPLY